MRIFGRKDSIYDEPIIEVLNSMNEYGPESQEYQALVDHLERLSKMKAEERGNRRVSPDTWVIVGGNVLGVLAIAAYEQRHILNVKALGFLLRPKQPN
jgi:hypothetical protein